MVFPIAKLSPKLNCCPVPIPLPINVSDNHRDTMRNHMHFSLSIAHDNKVLIGLLLGGCHLVNYLNTKITIIFILECLAIMP